MVATEFDYLYIMCFEMSSIIRLELFVLEDYASNNARIDLAGFSTSSNLHAKA